MEIPLIGLLALPLGLVLFFLSGKWLYQLAVFSVPFTATAVVVLGKGAVVSVAMYFGSLWMVRILPTIFRRRDGSLRETLPLPVVLLIAFVAVALISLLTPLLNDGSISVYQIDTARMVPLSLTLNHLVHLLQISYGVAFAIALGLHNRSMERLIYTLKILVASLVFVALWGFAELFANYSGMQFPYYLFNNTLSDLALAENGMSQRILLEIGLVRLSSVCDEPSIAARTLLLGVSILLVAVVHRSPLYSSKMDLLILLFLVIALVATGSASGIIGAFVALVVALFLGWRMRVNVLRSTVVFFAFMLLVALVWLLNFEVQVFVEKFMIYKLDTDSGVERLRSVAASWQIFESTPIFGGGWGSVTSDDLVVRLMSNVGLVGTSVFLLMLLVIHRALWRVFVNRLVRRDSRIIMLGAVWVTFVAYWFVVEIAGWSYQFQVSFLVLGLAMSAAHLARHYVATKEENIPAIISHISPELLKISSSG